MEAMKTTDKSDLPGHRHKSDLPSYRLLCVALTVSFGCSFNFGYHLVITNSSQHAFIAFVNDSFQEHYSNPLNSSSAAAIWSVAVAVMFVGAIIGSLMIRLVAEYVGRKRGLYIGIGSQIGALVLSIISYFVNSFEMYIISRIISGTAICMSMGLQALYISESSPKACRGFVSMLTGTNVQFGTVIGSVLAMPCLFGQSNLWWYIYLIEIIILLIVLAALPFMPESPGYLVSCGKDSTASKSIQFFWKYSANEAEMAVAEIHANLKQETSSLSMMEIWKDQKTRDGTIVGMVVCFAMAFSGITVINAFAVQILMLTGFSLTDASIGNTVLSFVSFVAVVISALVIDRFGRRPLILISLTAIVILNIAIFLLMYLFDHFQYHWIGYTLVIVICIFIVFFAFGPGPLCYFISAEMVGQEVRSASQSWASITQMTARALLLAVYLPFSDAVGQAYAYLLLFVAPVLISLIYLYFKMPETKNKNLVEVWEAAKKLPSLNHILQRR